jgi:hypothetical protein
VLETKQGTDTTDTAKKTELAQLGLLAEKRRKGHAQRGTAKWRQMRESARQQALGYVRALPASEPRPLFVVVADVGFCLDLYSNFAGVGDSFVPFPDSQRFRLPLAAQLAALSAQLEAAGHSSEVMAALRYKLKYYPIASPANDSSVLSTTAENLTTTFS